MAAEREHWSVEREYALGKEQGWFPDVDRADLCLAGMSLASISNLPEAVTDAAHAPGALLSFMTGAPTVSTARASPLQTLILARWPCVPACDLFNMCCTPWKVYAQLSSIITTIRGCI